MAGRGSAPDPAAQLPQPLPGISPASAAVWTSWFTSWWAGNWTTDDVPSLRLVIRLWDRVNRGDVKRAAELRQWMDGYGLTPKGQQDRRWARPSPPHPMTALERILAQAAQRGGSVCSVRSSEAPRIPRRLIVTLAAYIEEGSHKAGAYRLGISEPTSRQRVSQRMRLGGARTAAEAVWVLRGELEAEERSA